MVVAPDSRREESDLRHDEGGTRYVTCFASDGSYFGPHLARNGRFQVGPKGKETSYADFDAALVALRSMNPPYWRRPNAHGNWGIVRGVVWKRTPGRG